MSLKRLIYYILSIFVLFSCTTRDDEFTPPEGSQGVAFIVTSIIEANNDRELITREGFEIELLDTSIGTSDTRQWELPPNTRITSGTLKDQKIKVKFSAGGATSDTLTVKLKKNADSGPLEGSVEIIVLEAASATLTATAVDPTAVFSIDPSTRTITTEAGTQVQFNTTVKGDLTEFDWKFPGQTPETSEEQNPIVTINKLGESGYNFRARSVVPFGDVKLPFYAENAEETFYKIIVTPSSKPLVVTGDVVELEDETIQIPINGELVDFSGQESFFTVTVEGMVFEIESVSKNSANAAFIDIKLVEPIYRPDVITVSYTGDAIQSTDTRTLSTFADLPVIMHNVNLFDPIAYDFEDGGLNWSLDGVNTALVTYTTDRASSGTTSMRIDNTGASQDVYNVNGAGARFNLEPGKTYSITYDVYLETGNAWEAFWPTIAGGAGAFFWQQWTDARAAAVPRGGWVTINKEVEIPATQNPDSLLDLFIKLRSGGGTGVGYIDNWFMVVKEERP